MSNFACWRIVLLAWLACLCAPAPGHAATPYAGHFDEPYRPGFHFTPPNAWMNDPNGLVYFKGKYHLYYQYYPDDTVWGPMHWGHAESTDLLHWTHLPIALYPDRLGWIFSGSAVIDHADSAGFGKDAMVAIYTYHNDAIWQQGRKNTESQGLAYSLDEGRSWTKYEGNPVLDNTGEQDFRDPKVFWHQPSRRWIMALAVGDRIRFFAAPDLKRWTFLSDFRPDGDAAGLGVWECPDLFQAPVRGSPDSKWVLIVNHGDKAPNGGSGTRYFVGDFDGRVYTHAQAARWLDAGTDFYAGVTFSNLPRDKPLLIAWMSNWQYATKVPTSPWRSAMTLPRELSLARRDDGYVLVQEIPASVTATQAPVLSVRRADTPFVRDGLDLAQAEVRFATGGARELLVELSNDRDEVFRIALDDDRVVTDRSRAGQSGFSDKFAASPQVMPLRGQRIRDYRLFLDRASIEILLNDGEFSMTNLVFPTTPYTSLRISTGDGSAIRRLRIATIPRTRD